MVKRRAISKEDKAMEPQNLPLLYKTLVPLLPERHSGLSLAAQKSFDFASTANAIPLTVEEFPLALRHYPIVLSGGQMPTPLALVGFQKGKNDYVDADGAWRDGAYVPAYLRRFPFSFVRESEEATRNILCADLSSTMFETNGDPERVLFTKDGTGKVVTAALDFCKRYETAQARTRAAMEEFASHELIGPSTVTITRGGKTLKVDGFQTISEEKMRELPDDVLASFMRRGLGNILSGHFTSLSNFSTMGDTV